MPPQSESIDSVFWIPVHAGWFAPAHGCLRMLRSGCLRSTTQDQPVETSRHQSRWELSAEFASGNKTALLRSCHECFGKKIPPDVVRLFTCRYRFGRGGTDFRTESERPAGHSSEE